MQLGVGHAVGRERQQRLQTVVAPVVRVSVEPQMQHRHQRFLVLLGVLEILKPLQQKFQNLFRLRERTVRRCEVEIESLNIG